MNYLVREIRALVAIGLWVTWATLGCELRVLDAMNNFGLWLT